MLDYPITTATPEYHGTTTREHGSRTDAFRRMLGTHYLVALIVVAILGSAIGVSAAAIQTAESASRAVPRTETCQRSYTGFSLDGGDDRVSEVVVCWDTEWNLNVPAVGASASGARPPSDSGQVPPRRRRLCLVWGSRPHQACRRPLGASRSGNRGEGPAR